MREASKRKDKRLTMQESDFDICGTDTQFCSPIIYLLYFFIRTLQSIFCCDQNRIVKCVTNRILSNCIVKILIYYLYLHNM